MPLDPIFRDELIKFLGSSSLFPKRFKEVSPPKLISQYFEEKPQSLISKENLDILKYELKFSISNITVISDLKDSLLPTIEAIIANCDNLKKLINMGFGVRNITDILKYSNEKVAQAVEQLILPENIKKFKWLLASRDEVIFYHMGEPFYGLGLTVDNISNIFCACGADISSAMDQLFSITNLNRMAELSISTDETAFYIKENPVTGLEFEAKDISAILRNVGADIGSVMDQLFLPANKCKIKELLTPIGKEAFRNELNEPVFGLGFAVYEFAAMVNKAGMLNFQTSIDNIFIVKNYSPIYSDPALLKLVLNKIELNKDPMPTLNLLLENFPDAEVQKEALLRVGGTGKIAGRKLSEIDFFELEGIFAEVKMELDADIEEVAKEGFCEVGDFVNPNAPLDDEFFGIVDMGADIHESPVQSARSKRKKEEADSLHSIFPDLKQFKASDILDFPPLEFQLPLSSFQPVSQPVVVASANGKTTKSIL